MGPGMEAHQPLVLAGVLTLMALALAVLDLVPAHGHAAQKARSCVLTPPLAVVALIEIELCLQRHIVGGQGE